MRVHEGSEGGSWEGLDTWLRQLSRPSRGEWAYREQGRINKPAKSGDLFYSGPIAVSYLFESLFPRLIRTQVYWHI